MLLSIHIVAMFKIGCASWEIARRDDEIVGKENKGSVANGLIAAIHQPIAKNPTRRKLEATAFQVRSW